ncbi:DUF58 domain-containing protein [Neobacillus rhizophilus]|uniref:DUF58 domain-containing protein n=1 Tax=Neobacillus rhizophilus TaxID=2833579 RepID=A0A942YWE1_9BACI|nr:DUF58 domain-containing protein [Neobacillus rhizophilus]MBS4214994.1 DUF58 domain-containing protein [Neobacillus rhizophilus]
MSADQQTTQQETEETDKPRKAIDTSYFFQKHAIWVLLAFFLVGVWFRFVPLILVSSFLIFLGFFIIAWKNQSLKKVQPTLELSKSRLFAGEEFQMHPAVFNDKWLPLIWLEWEFPKNKDITIGEKERDTYFIRFLWLLSHQRVKWTIDGKAHRRGVYDLGNVKLRSGDGFRFAESEEEHSLNKSLYVYPQLVPVMVPAFRPSMQWAAKGKNGGFLEDPLLISGIRDYQPGDELRRFNWRASARTGRLQRNVYQPVVSEQIMVYGDVSGFVMNRTLFEDQVEQKKYTTKQIDRFEEFLSVIASVAVRYHDQGIRVGYATNSISYKGEKMSVVTPSPDLRQMLDVLAKSTQRVPQNDLVLTELLFNRLLSGPLFIFCESVTKDHVLWYQKYKQKLPDVRFFYQKESDFAEKVNAKKLDIFLKASGSVAEGS